MDAKEAIMIEQYKQCFEEIRNDTNFTAKLLIVVFSINVIIISLFITYASSSKFSIEGVFFVTACLSLLGWVGVTYGAKNLGKTGLWQIVRIKTSRKIEDELKSPFHLFGENKVEDVFRELGLNIPEQYWFEKMGWNEFKVNFFNSLNRIWKVIFFFSLAGILMVHVVLPLSR